MKRTLITSLLILFLAAAGYAQQQGVSQYVVLQSSTVLPQAAGDSAGPARYFQIKDVKEVTVALQITDADRTTGDETYDVYITTGIRTPNGGVAEWDIAHFPQIATAGVKTYVAAVKGYGTATPQTVTTAGPGVVAVNTGTMKVDTAGAAEGVRSLGAGLVRHGVLGEFIRYRLVTAGTSPILTFSISAVAK